jgi:hypothetical protein
VNVVGVKGNPRSSGFDRAAADFYCEPPRAVEALLDVEEFLPTVWDPACGSGNIPRVCAARGIDAVGSDIVQRGAALWTGDFLAPSNGFTAPSIITNPPFNLAVDFVLQALSFADKVAILQRLSWLEGERRYQQLFSRGQLARIWQFRSRISMPPGGTTIEPKGGSVAFCWFVFVRKNEASFCGGWLP